MANYTGIFIYENSITPDLCERLIKLYKDNKDSPLCLHEDHGPNKNVKCNYILTRFFPEIDNELTGVVINILKKTCEKDNPYLNCTGDSAYQLREVHGATRLHADQVVDPSNLGKARTISLILALNSDYDGGEFYFPFQDYRVKLKQGDAIIFPAAHTHPHEVSSPENGTLRYTINTWIFG